MPGGEAGLVQARHQAAAGAQMEAQVGGGDTTAISCACRLYLADRSADHAWAQLSRGLAIQLDRGGEKAALVSCRVTGLIASLQ